MPLLAAGEVVVPFPDTGATGAEVMVLVESVEDVDEIVSATLDDAMLLEGTMLLE